MANDKVKRSLKINDFARGTSSATLIILFVAAIALFITITCPTAYFDEWQLDIYDAISPSDIYAKYRFSVYLFEGPIMAIGGIILGLVQFSFTFMKSKCTTFLSNAVPRKAVFRNRLILPIAALEITLIAIKLIAYHANTVVYGITSELLTYCITDLLTTMCAGLYAYTITVACCVLTQNWRNTITTILLIIVGGSAFESIADNVLHATLYGGVHSALGTGIAYLDPMQIMFTAALQEITFDMIKSNRVYLYLAGAVAMLIACVVSLWLLQNHFCKSFKPENTGKTANCKSITILAVILGGLLGCSLVISPIYDYFSPFFNNKIIIIIVMSGIVAGIIASLLANTILTHKLKLHKNVLWGSVAAAVTVIICFTLGITNCFGLYDRVPEVEDIESIEISVPFDGFIPVADINTGFTTCDVLSTRNLTLTQKDSIELATTIHKATVNDKTPEFAGSLKLTYTLKNGKQIKRKYTKLSESAYDCTMALWDTSEVKEYYKNVLLTPESIKEQIDKGDYSLCYTDDTSQVTIVSKYGYKERQDTLSLPEQIKVKEAIYKDVCKLSYRDYFMSETPQMGAVQIDYVPSTYSFYRNFNFYITDKCTNTLKVLEELKLLDKLSTPRSIKSVYCVDIERFLEEQLPIVNAVYFNAFNKKELKQTHIPHYDTEQNNYITTFRYSPYNVTDSTKWQALHDKAYHSYYVKNNGKLLMVEYEDNGRAFYVIPE